MITLSQRFPGGWLPRRKTKRVSLSPVALSPFEPHFAPLSELVRGRVGEMPGPRVSSTTIHQRSKSFSDRRGVDGSLEASDRAKLDMGHLKNSFKTMKRQSPKAEVQNSLKQEIQQLEKRLQDQFQVRRVLEKALGYRAIADNGSSETLMPKPATELINEIAVLELEVGHLEQYLLTLYRKAFDQQVSSVSPPSKEEGFKSPLTTASRRCLDFSTPEALSKREVPITQDITSKRETTSTHSESQSHDVQSKESTTTREDERPLDSGVHRCHSSLSQRATIKASPPADSLGRALKSCYSQPLSMMEYAQNESNIVSLAEHLGTVISDHVPETPNKLSEDMIKCMGAIYCKLSDPPLSSNCLSSPVSSLSSVSAFSPRDQCDMWSPGLRNNSSFDVRLDNPFLVEGFKEFSGPYSTMVEVPSICRDSQKLGDVENLLRDFRSLICRLEGTNPRKLKHEEKLAFWINVHNSLVMHAFLAYGIPRNNVRRLFLLLKAAYNIGGHTICADTIQSSILGCRMSRPGQWLRLLLPSKSKFKTGDDRQSYAVDHPEPLLHFALCSGSHSDPAVRVYTPKRVLQELETAKEEYIRATFGIRKDQKILLPRMVESYVKESGLCQGGVVEMIEDAVPDSLRKCIKKAHQAKQRRSIDWIPHNFTFRYLISKELVR